MTRARTGLLFFPGGGRGGGGPCARPSDAGGEYRDTESELCPFSLFSSEESTASAKRYAEVFNLLIRRYRCVLS